MSNCIPRLTAVVAAWLLAGVAAQAQTGEVSLAAGPDISADHMETDSNGWFRAAGKVFIRYADHDLRADRVDLNRETGQVHARGHIEMFQKEQGRWTGDALDYNYITREGMTGVSEVRVNNFTVLADETHVQSNGMKRMINASLTTCANAGPADWHYWIEAGEIDFREHDRITLHDAVVYYMDFPLLYLPYATRDLNQPFGPRLYPGFRSDWGPFLLSTYTYPAYDPPGPKSYVGNVLLDYRGSRGLAYGHELDWILGDPGKGRFGFYLTKDSDPNNPDAPTVMPIDANRYRLYLQHEANPTPVDQVLIQGDVLSDSRMMEDFFPASFREQSQPDSFFAYTHRGLTYAAGFGANAPLNEGFTGVAHVPEGWLRVMPQELFEEESGLYYESDSSAGYLAQQWASDGTTTNAFAPDTVRIHSKQKLTYPFVALDEINVVPRAIYDYTFYSHLTDGTGTPNSRTNDVRSQFEIGAEASMKWFGTYGSYRHVFEPYLDYAIVTTPLNVKPGENYFFDRVDGPREWSDQFGLDGNYAARQWHGVRPGMRNSVQEKEADGTVRTVFDWDVFVAYRIGGQGKTNDGLCMAGWDLVYRPDSDVKFRTQALNDPQGGRLDMSDTSLTLGENRGTSLEIGYFTSDPLDPSLLNRLADPQLAGINRRRSVRLARVSVTHCFDEEWRGNLFLRYDMDGRELDEIGGYMQYELDCLAFRMTSGYRPSITRDDGSTRAVDYRVAFQVWVKAFQADYIEKMRGW
ncbi:MAG: hypothetical protein WCI17_10985 [bacterium]